MRRLIVIAGVVAAFCAGVYVGAYPHTPVVGGLKGLIAPDRVTIPEDQVETLIENDFYRKIAPEKLVDGSINGMIKALDDRWSHYFDPEQNKLFEQAISGHYDGVGVAVLEHKQGLLITHVYPGTPAAEAKIQKSDVITTVDGTKVAGQSADAIVTKIKGPAGTRVTLGIASPLKGERGRSAKLGPESSHRLTRRSIDLPVAEGRIVHHEGRKVGVVALASFTETSGRLVREQVAKLKQRGAGSYVLDLRGNGGGRLNQAVAVSSIFLPDGMVVATDGRSLRRKVYKAEKDDFLTAAPLAVLVDHGSASASEITAGALKYRDRGLIVGVRTFGKGVFQEVTELKNGGAVTLTVGRYELPGKHFIGKNGLAPDLKVEDDPKTDPDEALDAALAALARFKNAPGK